MSTQIYDDFAALETDLETVADSAEHQVFTPFSKARLAVAALTTGSVALFYGDQPMDAFIKSIYMTLGTILGVGFASSFKRGEIAAPIAGLSYYVMTTRSNALDYGSNQPVFVEAIAGALAGEAGSQVMAARDAKSDKPNTTKPAAAKPKSTSACGCKQ